MDYYAFDGDIKIFTALADTIDKRIEEKIRSDNDYDRRFRHPILDEINNKFKTNPYGLDMNMIPVRLRDRNKQSAYGWYADDSNNIININTDIGMLLTNRTDVYEVTKQKIMKRYAKSCTARSMFAKIVSIVENYKQELAEQNQKCDKHRATKRRHASKNDISESEQTQNTESDIDMPSDKSYEYAYYSEEDEYDKMMPSSDYEYEEII